MLPRIEIMDTTLRDGEQTRAASATFFVQTVVTGAAGGKEFKTRGLDAAQAGEAVAATVKMPSRIETTYNEHGF